MNATAIHPVVYLSGAMTGVPEHNFPLFNRVAAEMRATGVEVFNPAESFEGRTDLPRSTYMRRDFEALLDVASKEGSPRGVVLLPGWEASKGARAEVIVAQELGLPFFHWDGRALQCMGMTPNSINPLPTVPLSVEEAQAALAYAVGKREYDNGSTHASATAAVYVDDAMKRLTGGGGETRITDPKTGGQKGAKPERFDLIPTEPLRYLALVYGMGAKKYADDNWRKGYDWKLSYGAMQRHLNAFWGGEDMDPESKLPHLAHACWHTMTLLWFSEFYKDGDTRAKSKNV